jgi:hypothetical protein
MAALFSTFRDCNPDFHHQVHSEAGAERFIAEHFGSRELAAFRACAVPAMQADYFRYCAVYVLGGIYADGDYRCLRSLRPLVDGDHPGEVFLSPTVARVNARKTRYVWNGFFAFREPGHPLLKLAREIATANVEARIAERVWPAGSNVGMSLWCTLGSGVFTLMRFMRDWGSFDAFIEGIAGSPAEPFGELYCEVVGSHERVAEAFDGVRVSPFERLANWVGDPEGPLPYKDTEAHWANFKTPIFR